MQNYTCNKMVYFFDMDGTLVETDHANNQAYRAAMRMVLNIELPEPSASRWSRCSIVRRYPNISQEDMERVVAKKETLYVAYLKDTVVNTALVSSLKTFSRLSKVYLVTNSSTVRAMQVLNYHGLTDCFDAFVCRDENKCGSYNKYATAVAKLGVDAKQVKVFENEPVEIRKAKRAGILAENIKHINLTVQKGCTLGS